MAAVALEKDDASARLLESVAAEEATSSSSSSSSRNDDNNSKESTPIANSKDPSQDPYVRSKVRNLKKPFNSLVIGSKARKHTPLMQRPLCESLEDRVEHFVKRRRIVRVEEGSTDDESNEGVDKEETKETGPDS